MKEIRGLLLKRTGLIWKTDFFTDIRIHTWQIDDIAKELYLNKNYLCDLFKKKEGVTIGTYILSEKIRLIRNMLTYSQYSYSEIATYFGFSSQSHLGKQFKKLTGMTLHQYREKFGVKDFQDFKSAQ